jgi:hypothetical protein
MTCLVAPFFLCHCEAIRRRPRQSHRPHSYLRVRGDCFVATLLAMTYLVAPFSLSPSESPVFPYVIRRPSQGGRGNLTVPIHTYEYPRDCFVAALLAMTCLMAPFFLCLSDSAPGGAVSPMSLRVRPFSLCHCEAIRRRTWQSHRPHSYLRVPERLLRRCAPRNDILVCCPSIPMSLPAITFLLYVIARPPLFPYVIARPSEGGRGNLS